VPGIGARTRSAEYLPDSSAMTAFRQFFHALTRAPMSRPQPISSESLRARSRFRRSMPGEIGLSTAARLYGVGR
jgi:hypothetical protein